MDDTQEQFLQERQPKTYAAYQNYVYLHNEDTNFPDFSQKMRDPKFATGVYNEIKDSPDIGKNVKIPQDKFMTDIIGEGWANDKDARKYKFYTQEAVNEAQTADEEAKMVSPQASDDPKVSGDSWWDRLTSRLSVRDRKSVV